MEDIKFNIEFKTEEDYIDPLIYYDHVYRGNHIGVFVAFAINILATEKEPYRIIQFMSENFIFPCMPSTTGNINNDLVIFFGFVTEDHYDDGLLDRIREFQKVYTSGIYYTKWREEIINFKNHMNIKLLGQKLI